MKLRLFLVVLYHSILFFCMIEKEVLSPNFDQFAKAIVLPFFQKRFTPISICFLREFSYQHETKIISSSFISFYFDFFV